MTQFAPLTGSIVGAAAGVAELLRHRRSRLIVAGAAAVYGLLYLYSLQHLVILPAGALRALPPLAIDVASDWPAKAFRAIVPYSYEPVLAVYLAQRVVLFLAIPNLLLGLALGALVGLNLAIAVAQFERHRACRRPGAGLLGTLPGLLTGFTCCVPTVALALGANSLLAVLALRSYFIPASVSLLAAGVLWGAQRLSRQMPTGFAVKDGVPQA